MDPIIIKESEVLDSNLSMLVPLYPLSKEKFDILRKNGWDYKANGGRFFVMFLAFLIKFVAVFVHSVFGAMTTNDHILKIDGFSSIDYWSLVITMILWIIFSYIIPKLTKSDRDKVIDECCRFYTSKKK